MYGFCCPVIGLTPLVCLSPIFLLFVPDHWCYQPGIEHFNDTELDAWKTLNLPKYVYNWCICTYSCKIKNNGIIYLIHICRIIGSEGQLRFSQCEMFSPSRNGTGNVIECPAGWDYDRSEFQSTLPSAFDWVCSRDHYATNVLTSTALGVVVGNIIFGLLADKWVLFSVGWYTHLHRFVNLYILFQGWTKTDILPITPNLLDFPDDQLILAT